MKKNTLRLIIPFVVFVGLVGFFLLSLGKDPGVLPSARLDQKLPAFTTVGLEENSPIISEQDLTGQVSLLNVWATWCAPCLEEHPVLVEISKQSQIPIYGLNYKDDNVSAKRWLADLGDPYQQILVDKSGDIAIDFGVYGVPETFVIDANGVIRYRHVGMVTMAIWNNHLKPIIEQLQVGT